MTLLFVEKQELAGVWTVWSFQTQRVLPHVSLPPSPPEAASELQNPSAPV